METIIFIVVLVIAVYVVFGNRSAERLSSPTMKPGKPTAPSSASRSSALLAAASNLDLSFSAPEIHADQIVTVRSQSSDAEYQVSLAEQTCTCPDFKAGRVTAPANHLSRCCKHLVRELNKRGAFDGSDKWLQAILSSGRGGPKAAWIIQRENSPPVAVTTSHSKEWINVYAHSVRSGERIANASGAIKEFGWSVPEQRWSYGESPPGARELRKLLAEIEAIN